MTFFFQLYQQYPISEELFLEDLQFSEDSKGYIHRCRCGGHFILPCDEATQTPDSELAVVCDNCSLAIIVLLPQNNRVSSQGVPSTDSTTGQVQNIVSEMTGAKHKISFNVPLNKVDVNVGDSAASWALNIDGLVNVSYESCETHTIGCSNDSKTNQVESGCNEKHSIDVHSCSALGEGNSSSTTSSSGSHSPLQCLLNPVTATNAVNSPLMQIDASNIISEKFDDNLATNVDAGIDSI